MAKRKNSTALFEVMRAAQQKSLERHGISMQGASNSNPTTANGSAHTAVAQSPAPLPVPQQPSDASAAAPVVGRTYGPASGQSQLKPLGTPAIRKWLSALMEKKPKAQVEAVAAAAPALDPHDPTAGITAQSLAMRGARPTPTPAATAPVEPNPEQVFVDESDDDIPLPVAAPRPATYTTTTVTTAAPTNGRPGAAAPAHANKVAIDRDRQEVTLKVRFQTVAIGVVATLVVVGLAYIAGKKTGGPAARTPTTPQIKDGPVQPGVLDPRGVNGDANKASSRIPGNGSAAPAPLNGSATLRTGDAGFVDSPVVNGLAKRDPTLNYCVIESYGPNQQQWALDVRDFLNSAGFACTIEIGRPNLSTRSGDYLIVGTRGFAPRYGNTPAYTNYKNGIEQASLSFPDKSKFRQPQMMMVKWADE